MNRALDLALVATPRDSNSPTARKGTRIDEQDGG